MLQRILLTSLLICAGVVLSAQEYNILDYGANPDGNAMNTSQIQSAIDDAYASGGGNVIIPGGRFLSGTLFLKSNVTLYLEKHAVLLGSTDPDHYRKLSRWKALVLADGQDNIGIAGEGMIDGQGRQLALHIDSLFHTGEIDSADYNFIEMRPKYYLRPQLIEFTKCNDVFVRDITLKNAACWVQNYNLCKNVIIHQIRVESDAYWNNDGIDISDCRNVRVTECFVNAADDGICLKSHFNDAFCDSIYIARCTVRSSASAVKFGTRSSGGFRNVVIEDIEVFDTFRSAIAIECVDGGFLENVTVDRINAKNTGNALFVRLGRRYKHRPFSTLRNVTLRNIRVEVAFERPDYAYDIRGPALPFFHNTFPSSITGLPGHPVENVVLENIEIIYPGRGNNGLANMPLSRLDDVPEKADAYPEYSMFGELPAWGFYVRHVNGLRMRNIRIGITSPDYRPAFVLDDVQNLDMQSIRISGDQKRYEIVLHNTRSVHIEPSLAVLRM